MDSEKTSGDASTEHYVDPVIEAYKKDVGRTLIRENLKLSYEDRIRQLESMMQFVEEAQRAMKIAQSRT